MPLQFYREKRFKITKTDGFRFEIPEYWDVVELKRIAEVVSGYAFPLKFQGKNLGKYPFIKVSDLNSSLKYIVLAENFIDDEDVQTMKVEIYPPNTIIFPKIGMAVYLNKFRILKTWGTFDNNIAGIIPKRVDSEFLYYHLQGNVDLKQLSAATTMPSIKKSILENLKIPLPPLPEQQKIAHVLMSIDKAIEAVDEAIVKAERIKKGLMQELLTEGIGHTEFKYSKELGCQIPIKWEILPAEKICFKVTDGTHDTPKPSEEGYYLITSKHLKNNKIDFSDAYFISEKDFNEINKRSKVDVGDVLFSMIGTIGITAIVKAEYPQFAIKNVGLFKTGGDFTLAYWLHYYFQSTYAEKYIQNNLKGTTQKYIPLYALRKFPIAIPPFPEQQKIVQILSKWDEVIELKKAKKEKLERMKKKVMELLLTGKVRVKQ